MIYFLVFTVSTLIGTIFYLAVSLRKSKRNHQQNLEMLQKMIDTLLDSQHIQDDKVLLSEQLRTKVSLANAKLNRDIHSLVHELVDILSRNNLINKN